MTLVKAAMAPSEMSESIEQLLAAEEEIAALTGTIALSEQNFDRIRFEYSQREKRLRHAILDLSMERAKLKGLSAAEPQNAPKLQEQVSDLGFQIGELTRRCEEMSVDRGKQIRDLDVEVKRYRTARKELEEKTATIFQELHVQVEALRPRAEGPAQKELYTRLDALPSGTGSVLQRASAESAADESPGG